MSESLKITERGGTGACFRPGCDLYGLALVHLQRAPYPNVLTRILKILRGESRENKVAFPAKITVNGRKTQILCTKSCQRSSDPPLVTVISPKQIRSEVQTFESDRRQVFEKHHWWE